MIKQPKHKNSTEGFIQMEKKHIDILNKALGNIELTETEERSLIWLCGWETSTLKNIISAFIKAKGVNND